jgi:hypothetical protein
VKIGLVIFVSVVAIPGTTFGIAYFSKSSSKWSAKAWLAIYIGLVVASLSTATWELMVCSIGAQLTMVVSKAAVSKEQKGASAKSRKCSHLRPPKAWERPFTEMHSEINSKLELTNFPPDLPFFLVIADLALTSNALALVMSLVLTDSQQLLLAGGVLLSISIAVYAAHRWLRNSAPSYGDILFSSPFSPSTTTTTATATTRKDQRVNPLEPDDADDIGGSSGVAHGRIYFALKLLVCTALGCFVAGAHGDDMDEQCEIGCSLDPTEHAIDFATNSPPWLNNCTFQTDWDNCVDGLVNLKLSIENGEVVGPNDKACIASVDNEEIDFDSCGSLKLLNCEWFVFDFPDYKNLLPMSDCVQASKPKSRPSPDKNGPGDKEGGNHHRARKMRKVRAPLPGAAGFNLVAAVLALVTAEQVRSGTLKKEPEEEKEEEWQVLAELRDHTGFANWSKNTGGWGTLEEHRDPSRCAGVTVESGKITKIDLDDSNLVGGESPHLNNHGCV